MNDRVDAVTRPFEEAADRNRDLALKENPFARAEILPEPRDALVRPRAALQSRASARFAFVAGDGDRAQRQDVRARELDAKRVDVQSGLRAGDVVRYGPNLAQPSEGPSIEIEVARADR